MCTKPWRQLPIRWKTIRIKLWNKKRTNGLLKLRPPRKQMDTSILFIRWPDLKIAGRIWRSMRITAPGIWWKLAWPIFKLRGSGNYSMWPSRWRIISTTLSGNKIDLGCLVMRKLSLLWSNCIRLQAIKNTWNYPIGFWSSEDMVTAKEESGTIHIGDPNMRRMMSR